MKRIAILAATWLSTLATPAATTNLISNGSFEAGTNGWILAGAARYSITNWPYQGVNALLVTNRPNFTNAPRQNVTAALLAAAGGSNWTTRFAVSVAAPTTVRAWLQVVASNGAQMQTNLHLLAERVVRATNSWTQISGTRTVTWSGVLSDATFYTEAGMRQEPAAGGLAYPNCVFDDFNVKPDTDADGLWDEEEDLAPPLGTGTNKLLADSDGDGLPDGWEVAQGLDANSTNGIAGAGGDVDGDGFSNWEEFRGDTQPTNSASFPGKPCHGNLPAAAAAELTYLARLPSHATQRVIAGQHLTDINAEWTNHILGLRAQTGQWPGVVSFAGEYGANAVLQMNVVEPRALEVWTNGGLPLIKWQMPNPWVGSGTPPVGSENLAELINPATALATNQFARSNYLVWRDAMADGLAHLRDAGVVVLFRPFSEMNGTWFWHGNKPRSHWIGLWRDLHQHFTTTRGLTNLLWVFEPDASVHVVNGSNASGTPIDYYYPGDDVTDVVGHNFYDNDWVLSFDSDAVWRGHGKIFAVPQAGSGSIRDGSWDNLIYLNGVTNSIPRLAFFCAWNSFPAPGGTTNRNAITDNLHATALMTHPLIVTRAGVNWRYELPFALSVELASPGQLRVHWQGGVLQHSTNLLDWADLPAAMQPHLHDTAGSAAGYWRLRR